MKRAARPVLRFVHALLAAGAAQRRGEAYCVAHGEGEVRLDATGVRRLQADGVIGGDQRRPVPLAGTRNWLKRQLLEQDPEAGQHRDLVHRPDGTTVNLAESPLARLAVAAAGESVAFLAPHQVAAGERVRALVARAGLQPRLTMSYSAAHVAGGGGPGRAAEIGDLAADARKRLAELHAVLPYDCAEVVLDVCGLEKGLQQIESERGWPRRSAKLVLRIGLDRLAEHYGLGAAAVGPESRRRRAWMEGERVAMFG